MSRHLNIALAVVFLIVGILSTANTIRFNNYVRETLPRDQAQEECNTKQIEVLQSWIESRAVRDAAMDHRDETAIAALDAIFTDGKARPEQIAAWRDAVADDRAVRAAAGEGRIPLPDC